MARVTVEDCVKKVDSRFKLVMLAAKRARQVSGGAPITVERDNDKNTVVALREIAEETISVEELEKTVLSDMRRPFASGSSKQDESEIDFLGEAAEAVESESDIEELSQDGELTIQEEDEIL